MSIVESLKRLFDPATHRQEEAERRADRDRPIRENTGPPKWFECRVCHHLGPEPTFCPKCLAGTMRPTHLKPEAPDRADAEPDPAVAALPVDGTLDLHTFAPGEVRELLSEYLAACQERGQLELRIVHGKGAGVLRRTVQSILSKDTRVESFRTASEDAGGWGATLVTLRPR
jgi:hypothetical protein